MITYDKFSKYSLQLLCGNRREFTLLEKNYVRCKRTLNSSRQPLNVLFYIFQEVVPKTAAWACTRVYSRNAILVNCYRDVCGHLLLQSNK